MNHSLDVLDTKAWYKQFWPWFLMALPATVVVACIFTIIVAVRSPLSLVDDDYYKEGLQINENLATRQLALDMGIEATLSIQNDYVQVDLSMNDGQIQQQSSLKLHFVHVTNSGLDHSYELQQIGPRRFEGNIDNPLNSRYLVRIVGYADTPDPDQGRWTIKSESRLITNGRNPILIPLSADPGK